MSRGLLVGTDYAVGSNYRGVWGLYGSYDYTMSPQTFRISSTALARHDRAVVAAKWPSRRTALGGVGYGAAAPSMGKANELPRGSTPQALVAMVIFGERGALDLVGATIS
jgi:hypothetical protein